MYCFSARMWEELHTEIRLEDMVISSTELCQGTFNEIGMYVGEHTVKKRTPHAVMRYGNLILYQLLAVLSWLSARWGKKFRKRLALWLCKLCLGSIVPHLQMLFLADRIAFPMNNFYLFSKNFPWKNSVIMSPRMFLNLMNCFREFPMLLAQYLSHILQALDTQNSRNLMKVSQYIPMEALWTEQLIIASVYQSTCSKCFL